MKKILKVLAVAAIVFGVLFSVAYFFVEAKGKEIFTAKVSEALKNPVEVGSLRVVFPLGLSIRDLNIQDYGHIKEARIGFGVFYLFSNYFAFSSLSLSEPSIVIQRTKTGEIVLGELPAEEVAAQPADISQNTAQNSGVKPPKKVAAFSFDKLVVRNGKIRFFDHSVGESALQIRVDAVNLKARHVSFPVKGTATEFILNGLVKGSEEDAASGRIQANGWINLVSKDMKSQISIEKLDGKLFSTYFSGKSINKSIKNMSVNLSADLESKHNDMSVKGKVSIDDVTLNTDKENNDKPSFEEMFLGSLQSMAKGVAIEFNFKTKMDSFKIDSFSFSGNIFN